MVRFRKAQCPLVERLANAMMFHGRNSGKKMQAVNIIRHAFEIIHLLTDQNPMQVRQERVAVLRTRDGYCSGQGSEKRKRESQGDRQIAQPCAGGAYVDPRELS